MNMSGKLGKICHKTRKNNFKKSRLKKSFYFCKNFVHVKKSSHRRVTSKSEDHSEVSWKGFRSEI